MPIYNELHKNFYTTRSQTLKIFCDEEQKNCTCRIEVWAGNENKLTCLNCIRKSNLKNELEKKRFLDKKQTFKILEGSSTGAIQTTKNCSCLSPIVRIENK